MEYDQEKVDEMVLALLWLTAFNKDQFGARAWKSHDWDVLDRLHAKGYISDPKTKAKSVVLSEEGTGQAQELFNRHFGGSNGKRSVNTVFHRSVNQMFTSDGHSEKSRGEESRAGAGEADRA